MASKNILLRSKLKKADRFLKNNQLTEAQSIYQQLAKSNSKSPDILLPLATIYRKTGKYENAAKLCQSVLKNEHSNEQALHILGSALQCMNDVEGAITRYKQAIAINPRQTETHYFLGNAYQQLSQLENAESSFRCAINLNPNFLEALSNLAAVLIELHKTDEARAFLIKADKIRPNCEQILCNLGEISLIENQLKKAIYYAERTLTINPKFFDANNLLGKAYNQHGEYDLSLKYFNCALDIQPNDIHIINNIAQIHERRQEFDKARELITPLLSNKPLHPVTLLTYSTLSRHFNEEAKATEYLEEALENEHTSAAIQISIHAELGKQYDRLKQYNDAFIHYKQANIIERELNNQFIKATPKHVSLENIKLWHEHYNKDFWDNVTQSNFTDETPVFVVGMPRSGTSLTEQIIATHNNAYGAGELSDIGQLAHQIKYANNSGFDFSNLSNTNQNTLNNAASQYLKHINKLSDNAPLVVNKMPTDFWYIGLISKLFPNAKIIHMIRNRLDTCISMYFQRFGASMTFTTDIEELADYYVSYEKVMNYWKAVLDIDILDINYEDLIEKHETTSRKIINFCGLDWEENCLNFYKTKRDVNTPSYDQVRMPIYNNSINRWKNYETNIAPLIEKLKTHHYL